MQPVLLQVSNVNSADNYLPIGIQLFFAIGFIATMMGLTHFFGPKRKTDDKLQNFESGIEIRGNATATGTEKISLDINRTQANTLIVPGTYGQGGLPATIAQFYYNTPTAAFWYGISTVNPVTIVITSITSNNVKGTFYGRVYESSGWGPGFKTITEGTFDVPIN